LVQQYDSVEGYNKDDDDGDDDVIMITITILERILMMMDIMSYA
jgi:hypothetical protein